MAEKEIERYRYAEVILPLPLPFTFTYSVPEEMLPKVSEGCRVLVQFGKKRILTGIVSELHNRQPEVYEAKALLEAPDEYPVVKKTQLGLFRWMASYYMCHLGEVINAALPSGLKLNSESRIQLNPAFDDEKMPFSEEELHIINTLDEKGSLTFPDISRHTGIKRAIPLIRSLLAKGKVLIYEEVKEKFSPKKEKRVRLNPRLLGDLKTVFEKVERKGTQLEVLLAYLSLVPVKTAPEKNEAGIEKNKLKEKVKSLASLNTLVKKEIFQEWERIIPRFEEDDLEEYGEINLSQAQQKAKEEILENFRTKDVVLLHGITGSGKTEVFIDMIRQAIEGGSQVLYLLPEIALTTQIVKRLRKIFGNGMAVYHSKYSDNERVEVYLGILTGKISLVLGVRSSIFLPFENLGLVIVDEEHETSYKQQEPSPRYQARDVALVLAKTHHAKTLLGTATPSVESYYQCMQGKWGLVKLSERYGEGKMPDVILSDITRERKFRTMKNDFSSLLLGEVKNSLDQKKQTIIFQNRRGYAPYLACDDCAHILKCRNCDVTLTYHMYKESVICHYCGHSEFVPGSCAACGSSKLRTVGFGTEKLEEDLKLFFPESSVFRMDLDTTRRKNSYEDIISQFEEGKIDILVGTQMVTKGFDFGNVTLVGVLDADRIIHFPDFRAHERAFQVLTQVSGRAGRRKDAGKVVLQTINTNQPILGKICRGDFEGFYLEEIQEREKFNYPPFTRMIRILFRDEEKVIAEKAAAEFAVTLKKKIGNERVLGPEAPIVNKIRNLYLMQIFVKLERDKINLASVKEILQDCAQRQLKPKEFRKTQIVFDVDPA